MGSHWERNGHLLAIRASSDAKSSQDKRLACSVQHAPGSTLHAVCGVRLIAFGRPCFQETENPAIRGPIQLDRHPRRQELGRMMREVAAMVAEAWDGRGSNLSMRLAEARLEGFRSGIGSRDRAASGVAEWRIGGMGDWGIGRMAAWQIGGGADRRIGARHSEPHLTAASCASNHLVARRMPYMSRRVMRPMWTEHDPEP
jgi:hypothetical protein